jgi:hypothetical protein
LNPRPSGYEPDELPGCSTPRFFEETHNALTGIFTQPFLEKIFCTRGASVFTNKRKRQHTNFEPAIRQLPDYEPDELPGCSTPRFFEETHNALTGIFTQPFLEKIFCTRGALTGIFTQPFLEKIFCTRGGLRCLRTNENDSAPILYPRSGSCRIMSLTSYQAAPPRVF